MINITQQDIESLLPSLGIIQLKPSEYNHIINEYPKVVNQYPTWNWREIVELLIDELYFG